MGQIKGQVQHQKFLDGKKLTRREAILAQCYVCNGEESSRSDCLGENNCSLYQYSPYKGFDGLESAKSDELDDDV
jgi:hypothetical protein